MIHRAYPVSQLQVFERKKKIKRKITNDTWITRRGIIIIIIGVILALDVFLDFQRDDADDRCDAERS